MEKRLDKFKKIYKELLENPDEKSVLDFCEYIRQEMASGHIAHLSACFKNITDAVTGLNPDNSTLDQLFGLDFHLFPEVFAASLEQDIVCIPDAVEMLLSLTGFLNDLCGKPLTGKTKLSGLLPVLIHGLILLSDKRTLPLRLDILRLTNLILEDMDQPTDQIGVAVKEVENKMENVLVTAGDFEFQAAFVELVFRIIPLDIRIAKAQEYFSSESVSQAFTDILNEEFEAGCRIFLNTLNQNHESVMPLPCNSASFGTEEVHKPKDVGITDFWVDFNFGSQCISLVVEESPSQENEKEGSSAWEIVVIKADNVQDYRLTEFRTVEVALLLKLNVPASDLIYFLPHNPSQYIKIAFNINLSVKELNCHTRLKKGVGNYRLEQDLHYKVSLREALAKILGRPEKKTQNSGGESDASSTSNKASVAINPVYIRSKKTEVTHVMPTASIMLQLSESTTDHEEENGKLQKKANGSISVDDKKPGLNSTENHQVKDVTSDKDEAEHRAGDTLYDKQTVQEDESVNGPNQDEPLTRNEDENNDAESKERFEQTEHEDTSKNGQKQDEPSSGYEDENNDAGNKESRKSATIPVKRISERIRSQAKRPSVQHSSEEDNKKDSMNRRKSLPSAFNVSGRLAASKQKTMPAKTLSEAAKSRKAIREKVFAKAGRSPPRLDKLIEAKYGDTKLHMMTPSRRRESRSGDASGCDSEDIREECTDVIQDSLPLADSMEDESEPKRQDLTGGEKGCFVKEKKGRERRQRAVPDLAPASNNSKGTTIPTGKLPQRSNTELKSKTTDKEASKGVKGKQKKPRNSLPLDEPKLTNSESEDIAENQNKPVLKESERIPAKKANRSVKGKQQQKLEETLPMAEPEDTESVDQNELVMTDVKRISSYQRRSQVMKRKYGKRKRPPPMVVLEDSDSESKDISKMQNEAVSREFNERPVNKKSTQWKQKDMLRDSPEASNSEIDDMLDDQNEPFWGGDGGSDEVTECYGETECYVEDASPRINSSPVAKAGKRRKRKTLFSEDCFTGNIGLSVLENVTVPTKKRTFSKEKRKADIARRSSFRTPLNTRESELQIEGSLQSQRSGEESESSEEEDIHLKRAKITPKLKTPTELSQPTEFSSTTEKGDYKEDDTVEESDSVHSDPELDYDLNLDITPYRKAHQKKQGKRLPGPCSGGSSAVKRSIMLNDSGIGETPLGEKRQKRSKQPKKTWKPLQVFITKTPVTPKSEQDEQDKGDSADAESDEEPISPDVEPTMTKMLRGKRKLVDWSTSGPSTSRVSAGTRTSHTEGWYEETLHVRSEHFGKPRKLSYDDKPYEEEETEEVITEGNEDFRSDIQSLISLAGGKVTNANRKACQIIKTYAQRVNEVTSCTIDTFWNEQQVASYYAIKKYKRQLADQIKSLETDLDKTASTVREMENTFMKHCKVLKSQRQVEEKRFKRIQHLQELMEAELTVIEQKRNKEETTLRAELEKETSKFQKKFLQETRKQKEDQLKMILNIMRIP